MPLRRDRVSASQPAFTEVEACLRHMIAHRPILSIPIDGYKDPNKHKKASVSSFSQAQEEQTALTRASVGSNSMFLDQLFNIEHPSLISLLTNNSEISSQAHGFEVLAPTQHFYVRSTTDSGPEYGNYAFRMEVLDHRGFRLFFAYESKNLDMKEKCCWCGVREIKPFKVRLLSFVGQEVMRVEGEPGVCGGGKMAHFYQGKRLLGHVEQDNDYGSTSYQLFNEQGQSLLCLSGPDSGCCGCGVTSTRSKLQFELLTKDHAFHLGKINKNRPRFSTQNPDKNAVNYFGAVFYSREIDVKVKVLVLGTLFLLHFEFINFSGRQD